MGRRPMAPVQTQQEGSGMSQSAAQDLASFRGSESSYRVAFNAGEMR